MPAGALTAPRLDEPALPRCRGVAAVLEGVRLDHDNGGAGEAVAVGWTERICGEHARDLARRLQRLLYCRRVGGAGLVDGIFVDLDAVVAQRDPPERELDVTSAELGLERIEQLLRRWR